MTEKEGAVRTELLRAISTEALDLAAEKRDGEQVALAVTAHIEHLVAGHDGRPAACGACGTAAVSQFIDALDRKGST